MLGLLGDEFGASHGMIKNNLIWVVSRMQVLVDHYPIWGEVVEIDTWVGASGKNGMRRDWVIRSQATGLVFTSATSTWVMMNQQTRRLSKMPEEVRNEISPWFIQKQAIKEDVPEKIVKLDNKAKYMNTDLKLKRSDLDMNHHVNNVKYIKWMLGTIADHTMEIHQLSCITLEYRRECGSSDIVQSHCETDEDENLQDNSTSLLNGFPLASEIIKGAGLMACLEKKPIGYTHLQIKGSLTMKKL
ncbi:Acyl-[acyl-carrier-protein] hydrolase [Quillaja saponaria]|uniref:Acyl-[acyl-carrier-protein] hydrolase n=1 Tax=Quillaja saponaria TaxID=32244 RepID=A0AAD7L9U0_QUISA|nr:Acyl-[acyl-carrier-protein] hydrolase [Quillaja saponaria]